MVTSRVVLNTVEQIVKKICCERNLITGCFVQFDDCVIEPAVHIVISFGDENLFVLGY